MKNETLLRIAKGELGQTEIKGPADNPRVIEYQKCTDLKWFSDDELAWCSCFMNWVCKQAGISGTGDAMARSWMRWGKPLEFSEVMPGDVVVFARGSDGVSGHVALVYSKPSSENDLIQILGGNQHDCVCIETVGRGRVLGYRRA